MPFKSKSQQRWMFAAEADNKLPKGTAKRWAHHTKNIKDLPEKVEPEEKQGSVMNTIQKIAAIAAERNLVEKLASDTNITPELVDYLAGMVGMAPLAFVKEAYANPHTYTTFLKVASGVLQPSQIKTAGAEGSMLSKLLSSIKNRVGGAYESARGRGNQVGGYTGKTQVIKGTPVTQDAVSGNAFDRFMGGGLLGGSRLGRNVQAGGLGVGGIAGADALTGSSSPKGGAAAQLPKPEIKPEIKPPTSGESLTGNVNPRALGQDTPQNPNSATAKVSGGMSPAQKALITIGGMGLGAAGVGAAIRGRKKKKEVTGADLYKNAMRLAIEKKAAAIYRKEAADVFCSYLDTIAQKLPFEKSASIRKIQTAIAEGKDLSVAIKCAYPTITGEQRGILASMLVNSCCKSAEFKGKVVERQEANVKMDKASKKLKSMSC